MGSLARQRKGERKAQKEFYLRARRYCARGHTPLIFVASVQSVEEASCSSVGHLDIEVTKFFVTATRRAVSDEEETKTLNLSRDVNRLAAKIVDKAASLNQFPIPMARKMVMYDPYEKARKLREIEDGCGEVAEAAPIQLLLERVGKLPLTASATSVADLISAQGSCLDDEAFHGFCTSLVQLSREENARREQAITFSIDAKVGGKEAAFSLPMERDRLQHVFDVSHLSTAITEAATVNHPSCCCPFTITSAGGNKFTLLTKAPPSSWEEALFYLDQVASSMQEAWKKSVTREERLVEEALSNPKNVFCAQLLLPSSPMQPSLNIGVIGDVANGKSTLIRSMTGKKTQAHSSEQQRHGITIRLGFANAGILKCSNASCGTFGFLAESKDKPEAKLPACVKCKNNTKVVKRVSFLDCPGHAELMATMLSGASSFDAVILAAAANVPCPTPQAKQHLEAIKFSGCLKEGKNVAIAQTKAELVADSSKDSLSTQTGEERLSNHALQGRRKLKKTLAASAPFFPTCSPMGLGFEPLAEWIANLDSQQEGTGADAKLVFQVLRSFDINKPGTGADQFSGGVLGGSIEQGSLSVGDELEIRPGLLVSQSENDHKAHSGSKAFTVQPIRCRCTTLQTGQTKLELASKGGLIAVGTTICPSLTADNQMVGALVGRPGQLPPVWGPSLLLDNLKFVSLVLESLGTTKEGKAQKTLLPSEVTKKGVIVRVHVGSSTIKGKIVRVSRREAKMEVLLDGPVCASKGASVAIEALLPSRVFALVSHAQIAGGDICVKGVEFPLKAKLIDDFEGKEGMLKHPGSDTEEEEDDDAGDTLRRQMFIRQLEGCAEHESSPLKKTIPVPILRREGGAHILVENFGIIAASLHGSTSRTHHIIKFLEKEGGLQSSLAGPSNSYLRVSWRGGANFSQRFLSILKKYIVHYITCHECKGAFTELRKSEVSCRQCNARRYVNNL